MAGATNTKLCGPFQTPFSHLYNSEQAFSLRGFTPKGQQNKNESPRDTPRCSLRQPCQHHRAPLLQPSPSPGPVTSAVAARAVPPWCRRSQGRPPRPSRWPPAALPVTPSSLRVPGSSLSAGKAHKSSVTRAHRPGQQPHSRKRQTGPANTTVPG